MVDLPFFFWLGIVRSSLRRVTHLRVKTSIALECIYTPGPGGRLPLKSGIGLDPLIDANVTFHGILIGDDGQRTRRLAARLADGSLRPVISHELPLAEAAQAHRILETGHPGGKIVLTVPG